MSHLSRSLTLSLCFAVAGISGAAPEYRTAPVMREARQFLQLAHKSFGDGSMDSAAAYAGAVLISDEVSVSVDLDAVPNPQRDSCKRALKDALAAWEVALENTVHFRMEDDPAKADVKLKYQPDVRMQREQVAGLTTWKRLIHSVNGKVTGISPKTEVLVRTRDPRFRAMSTAAMRQATEHELGHVLGLEDSEHMGDIMGQLDIDHPVSAPRDYEVSAVKELRDEARQIKTEAEARHQNP
jgi:hypothetical protein